MMMDVKYVCKNSWTYAALATVQYCSVGYLSAQRGDDPPRLSTRNYVSVRSNKNNDLRESGLLRPRWLIHFLLFTKKKNERGDRSPES